MSKYGPEKIPYLVVFHTVPGYTQVFFCDPQIFKWYKAFKNGPSKICGRQVLKNLKKGYGLLKQTIISLQIFGRLCSRKFTGSILEYILLNKAPAKTSSQVCMLLV